MFKLLNIMFFQYSRFLQKKFSYQIKFNDECISFTEQFNREDALLIDIIS